MRFARPLLITALLLGLVAAPVGARPADGMGARVINGSDAPAGAWPSIVYLQANAGTNYDGNAGVDSWACGGSVIAPRVILTAAHCTMDPNGVLAAVGVARAGVLLRADTSTQRSWQIADLLPHPGYDPATSANDVALVVLSADTAAPAMPLIAPWQDGLVVGGAQAGIAGWGRTVNGGAISPTLRQATVPLFSDADCARVWGPDFQAASMVCAGDLASGIDTCHGDSGGPLALTIAGVRTLVGDTSWGTVTCASGAPGVYGRISAFRGWILDGTSPASTLVRAHVAAQTATAQGLALTSAGPDVTLTWGVTAANWTTTGFRVTVKGSTETVAGPSAARTVAIPAGGAVTASVEPVVTLGAAASATITATPTPTRAPVVTAQVDATPRAGSVLTAAGTSDDPWGGALTYAWRVDGVLVQEGAQTTYRPTAAQAGRPVTVTVSAANAVGTGSTVVDAGRVTQSPQITAGPVPVRGAARVGGRLQARPPAVAGYPKPRATYRWFRNGRLVRSAKTSAYRVRQLDAGARITGRVTWTNAAGTVTRALRPVAITA